MDSVRLRRVGALCVIGLLAISCSSTNRAHINTHAQRCDETTIQALAADPGRFEGRRICVSGFFRRIVPYGETSFELFPTREEAETGHADFFLDLGIRWDVMLQARLSQHSAEFTRAEGIFEHDPQCWPAPGQQEPDYRCSPPRRMKLRFVLLRFSDGTEYRHPEFITQVQRGRYRSPENRTPD